MIPTTVIRIESQPEPYRPTVLLAEDGTATDEAGHVLAGTARTDQFGRTVFAPRDWPGWEVTADFVAARTLAGLATAAARAAYWQARLQETAGPWAAEAVELLALEPPPLDQLGSAHYVWEAGED